MVPTNSSETPILRSAPTGGVSVHRDDGELLGFLLPTGNQWLPCTVFGFPLAGALTQDAASDYLLAYGLSCLADRWEMHDGDAWVNVAIIEANPASVTITFADYGRPELFGERRTLSAPVGQQLRRG